MFALNKRRGVVERRKIGAHRQTKYVVYKYTISVDLGRMTDRLNIKNRAIQVYIHIIYSFIILYILHSLTYLTMKPFSHVHDGIVVYDSHSNKFKLSSVTCTCATVYPIVSA